MANPKRAGQILLALVALFALIGLADAFLFHLKEITAATATTTDPFATCKINSFLDCGPVAKSIYSKFLGVPVSLFGMLFSEGILLTALAMFLGFPLKRWQGHIISFGVVFGLLFVLRLLYYSIFAIGFVCPYCLVTDLATLGLNITWLIWCYKFAPFNQSKEQ